MTSTKTSQMTAAHADVRGALVSPVDAALRTGLAGGAQEMVHAYPAAASAGRVDLAVFVGEQVTVAWPTVTVLERGTF